MKKIILIILFVAELSSWATNKNNPVSTEFTGVIDYDAIQIKFFITECI